MNTFFLLNIRLNTIQHWHQKKIIIVTFQIAVLYWYTILIHVFILLVDKESKNQCLACWHYNAFLNVTIESEAQHGAAWNYKYIHQVFWSPLYTLKVLLFAFKLFCIHIEPLLLVHGHSLSRSSPRGPPRGEADTLFSNNISASKPKQVNLNPPCHVGIGFGSGLYLAYGETGEGCLPDTPHSSIVNPAIIICKNDSKE